jgi:hypothetical protein
MKMRWASPRFGEQIKTSALCGSCHTVVLPVLDDQGKPVRDKNGKPKSFTSKPLILNG